MMFALAVGSLLIGALIGAALFKIFKSDDVRIHQLEAKLLQVSEEYEQYKRDVQHHFSDSAALINNLTKSYHEVYQHLSQGARTLCPEHVAKQITAVPLAISSDEIGAKYFDEPPELLTPPLDYASPTSNRNDT